MTISWYSISISLQSGGGEIFNGYFSVDNNTNLVTSFYETINGSTNFQNNILGPANDPWNADNYFNQTNLSFNFDGVNITSVSLQNAFNTETPYYNLYYKYSLFKPMRIDGPVNGVVTPTSNPISNICFPAGTPITCNQGNIPIEKINPDIHTIRNKKIVGITQTITQDKYLVCFEKDALGTNFPSQKTIISKNHKILYKKNMKEAEEFIGINDKVYKIKYRKEVLYNVLMEEHDKMVVNNLICETLHPENGIAELYKMLQKLNPEQQIDLINFHNEYVNKNKIFTSKK